MFIRTMALIGFMSLFSGCAADGTIYKEGKKFSPIRTILTIGAIGVGVAAAAACADRPGCMKGLTGGNTTSAFTGGPHWDWDEFSNGQYRCRDINDGRFVKDYLCRGMPRDDDRWPSY